MKTGLLTREYLLTVSFPSLEISVLLWTGFYRSSSSEWWLEWSAWACHTLRSVNKQGTESWSLLSRWIFIRRTSRVWNGFVADGAKSKSGVCGDDWYISLDSALVDYRQQTALRGGAWKLATSTCGGLSTSWSLKCLFKALLLIYKLLEVPFTDSCNLKTKTTTSHVSSNKIVSREKLFQTSWYNFSSQIVKFVKILPLLVGFSSLISFLVNLCFVLDVLLTNYNEELLPFSSNLKIISESWR